jgi:FtsP/CotA-like multicopper oxidase with cupredoxin domain
VHLEADPGENVRLRLVNAVAPDMDGGPQTPVLFGAAYRVVALDGQDLNEPQLLGPERLPLGMGQRADVVFTMPAREQFGWSTASSEAVPHSTESDDSACLVR